MKNKITADATNNRFRIVIACGYIIPILYLGQIDHFSFPPFAAAYITSLGAYFFILKKLAKLSRNELVILAVLGLVARILFVFQDPLLSNDLYRCLWEGLVTLNGKNPYVLAPNNQELANLRPAWHQLINHPAYPAIYPPVTTFFNTLIAAIKPTPLFYKASLTLVDIVLSAVIGLRLKLLQMPKRLLMIYFLNPLPIIEISGNGHHEPLVLLLAILAFCFIDQQKLNRAAVAFSGAVLSKYFFLVLITKFLNRRTFFYLAGLSAALFAPFLVGVDKNPFFSLGAYLEHWDFNASLYRLGTLITTDHLKIRICLVLLYCSFWLYVNLRNKIKNPHQQPLMLLFVLILVLPTVHPWYGLWLLPFLVFYRFQPGLIFISLLPLSYIVLDKFQKNGIWQENFWITFLIYSPLLFVMTKKYYVAVNKSKKGRP